jgi:hypothetical protein
VTEWVGETTLAMNTPWNEVILNAVDSNGRPSSDCLFNERVGLIDEDFKSDSGVASDSRTRKSVFVRFVEEKRCTTNVQTYDGTEVP